MSKKIKKIRKSMKGKTSKKFLKRARSTIIATKDLTRGFKKHKSLIDSFKEKAKEVLKKII